MASNNQILQKVEIKNLSFQRPLLYQTKLLNIYVEMRFVIHNLSNLQIAKKLSKLHNILKAYLYAILVALENTTKAPTNMFIFRDCVNSMYLIKNHIKR